MRWDARYRSLSSVARTLLPTAEEMHRQGMPWERVARSLRVSPSALFIWRRLKDTEQAPEQTCPEAPNLYQQAPEA